MKHSLEIVYSQTSNKCCDEVEKEEAELKDDSLLDTTEILGRAINGWRSHSVRHVKESYDKLREIAF